MHLSNINFEDMTQDTEFDNPFYIIYADIYEGSNKIGSVEADIFPHFSNEIEWHTDGEYSHVSTWRMDPEARLILSDHIDEDLIWSSEIFDELEQHIDDKLNLPIFKIYDIDPNFHLEPGCHSGFGSFSIRAQLFNDTIEMHGINYELSQKGLNFTGDNDGSYRKALSTIQSHYGFTDRKIENIDHAILKLLQSNLKNDFGITNLEDALACQA